MKTNKIVGKLKKSALQLIEDMKMGMAMVRLYNDIEDRKREYPDLNAAELADTVYHVEERTLRNWKAKGPGVKALENMVDVIDGVNTVEELESFSAVEILKRAKARSGEDPGFIVCLIICTLVPIVLFLTAIKPTTELYLFSIALMSLSLHAMQNINLFHPNIEVKKDRLDKLLDGIGIACAIYLIIIVAL